MGTPSHVHLQRRAIIITIFRASVLNCMVPSDSDLALFFFLALMCVCGVFCFVSLNRYWEINEVPGFLLERAKSARSLDLHSPPLHLTLTSLRIFSVIFPDLTDV